MYAYW